jgi:hypothetical protein
MTIEFVKERDVEVTLRGCPGYLFAVTPPSLCVTKFGIIIKDRNPSIRIDNGNSTWKEIVASHCAALVHRPIYELSFLVEIREYLHRLDSGFDGMIQ